MTPTSHAAVPTELASSPAESVPLGPAHIHAPIPGATATLIHDLRELDLQVPLQYTNYR